MTGFGRATVPVGEQALQIEIRTLNHRHADVQVRLPRILQGLDHELRAQAKRVFGRARSTSA